MTINQSESNDSLTRAALVSQLKTIQSIQKDIDVLWSSARITTEALDSINRVISNLVDRVNKLETKGAI